MAATMVTQYQTARTDRHGDATLTVLNGDYSYVAVQVLNSACDVVPWAPERGDWQVRAYKSDGRPARFRRIRLVVTTMRAGES